MSGNVADQISKLPISNYDVVVYFGVGVASLPFANRYFLSGDAKFPPLFDGYVDPLINTTVSIVALIFAVYILGHGIAILASMFVEQFLYRNCGPPSRIIANVAKPGLGIGTGFRTNLKERLRDTYVIDRHPADIIRLILHLPVLPLYLAMYAIGFHGFYECKLNAFVVMRVQERLERCFDFHDSILSNKKWFKIVEYACSNEHAVATSKMYNYMVIYGLFRSVSFMTLASIWLEVFYYFHVGGIGFIDSGGTGSMIFRMFVLYFVYVVSFVGYSKFTRRYSEEAVQAFALSKIFAK